MRARQIKPGFFKNEILAACAPHARLLFAGLWQLADREGRLEDRPTRIKAELFPYENLDTESLLIELASKMDRTGKAELIIRYSHPQGKFIQIVNFQRHQNPHIKEAASTIPAPDSPGASTVQAGKRHKRARLTPSSLTPDSPLLTPDSKGSLAATEKPVAPTIPAEQPLMTFPTDGKTNTWDLLPKGVAELQEAFPSLDILAEARKALKWSKDNPTKRKTDKGMPKFLFGWMNRAQNSGKGAQRPPKPDNIRERWAKSDIVRNGKDE